MFLNTTNFSDRAHFTEEHNNLWYYAWNMSWFPNFLPAVPIWESYGESTLLAKGVCFPSLTNNSSGQLRSSTDGHQMEGPAKKMAGTIKILKDIKS